MYQGLHCWKSPRRNFLFPCLSCFFIDPLNALLQLAKFGGWCRNAAQFSVNIVYFANASRRCCDSSSKSSRSSKKKKPKHQIIPRLTSRSQGSALPVYMLTNPCLSIPSTPDHQVLHLIMYSV